MHETAPNRWLTLVVVCFAQFMVVLDATIVNVALPSIQADLDMTPSGLQWIVNSYTLLFGGFLLLGGRAADLVGRRRLFLIGVALFSVASLANALAPNGDVLIVARGLQGLGAALLSPAALSIITTSFAEGEERTKALGVWGTIAGVGGAFGLLLGGILTDLLSWEWVFFVNIPIGIGVAAAALRWVPESRADLVGEQRRFDLAGAVSVTAGLLLLVYALVKAEEKGWDVAAHARSRRHRDRPARPLRGHRAPLEGPARAASKLFSIRSLSVANSAMLIVVGGMFGMFFFVSLYVQQILGYSPLKAGVAFLPVTVGIIIGATLSQQLIKRIGVRTTSFIGMAPGRRRARRARADDEGRRRLRRHPRRPGAVLGRHGPDLRAADARGHHERRSRGRGPRLGRVQHLPAGRRRARPRRPDDAGQRPHDELAHRPRPRAEPPSRPPASSRASSSRSS